MSTRSPFGGAARSVFLVAVLLGLAATSRSFAGAWTLSEGEGLSILTIERSQSAGRFGRDRRRVAAKGAEKDEARLHVEYGLSDRVTLRGKASTARFEVEGARPGDSKSVEFGDIGARFKMIERGGFVGSVEASVRVANAFGTGVEDYEARLLGGYGFAIAGLPAFVDAQLGYLHRPGGAGDDVLFDLSVGIRPFERTQIILQTFSAVAGAFDEDGLPLSDRHRIQASVVQDLTARWSVQLGAGTTILGREALAEHSALAALWLRF